MSVATVIDSLKLSGCEVNALDSASNVIFSHTVWKQVAVHIDPTKAAAIADVATTIRTNCRTVGAASEICNHLYLAARLYSAKCAAFDLD
jgi:hypothetical protein